MLQNKKDKSKQKAYAKPTPVAAQPQSVAQSRLFVKVDGLSDRRIRSLERLALLNGGDTQIVLFDATNKKYVSMKDTCIRPDDAVMQRLYELFGQENIILRS